MTLLGGGINLCKSDPEARIVMHNASANLGEDASRSLAL